jgi:hypothetical protein
MCQDIRRDFWKNMTAEKKKSVQRNEAMKSFLNQTVLRKSVQILRRHTTIYCFIGAINVFCPEFN